MVMSSKFDFVLQLYCVLLIEASATENPERCVSDSGAVAARVEAAVNSGDCRSALDTLAEFTITCVSDGDRAADHLSVLNTLPILITGGCGTDLVTPNFPIECTNLTCAGIDFRSDCGENNENVYSALGCYIGFAIRGCEVAKADLLRLPKLIFETCPLACRRPSNDSRLAELVSISARAGLCKIAHTLEFDHSVECTLTGRAEDGIKDIGGMSGFAELIEACPKPFEQVEPGCYRIEDCTFLGLDGQLQVKCDSADDAVNCYTASMDRGCSLAARFVPLYLAAVEAQCPKPIRTQPPISTRVWVG